ncbi:MAG: GTP cyclohydrolase II [Candidatus Competibacteraceae bacterium]|nr:GTP cyclohydrolase II [Candidatus Competibacteraceae bacterium]
MNNDFRVDGVSDKVAYIDLNGEDRAMEGERLGIIGPISLPLRVGDGVNAEAEFKWYVFARLAKEESMPAGMLANSALVYGDPASIDTPLVRFHSGCHTGDLFYSMRCDCGAQLQKALSAIVTEGSGVALYLTLQEGRGIGLWAKAMTYLLQENGLNTYEANLELGYPADARCYCDATLVLLHLLGKNRIRLLSNNPHKRAAIEESGIEVVEMCSLVAGHTSRNQRYVEAKMRNGHRFAGRSLNG